MTLFDLVQKHAWADIEPVFLQLRPGENHTLATYASVYDQLRHLEPEASDLCIKIKGRKDKEGQQYIDVYGAERTYHVEVTQDEASTGMESVEDYGLDLAMWPEWLGMQIDESTLAAYGEKVTLSHCLYELTFYGYTLNEVTEHRDRVIHGI